jgi:hypothetical protein
VIIGNLHRPSNLSLCIFSALWVIAALWFGLSFALAGKIISAVVMGLFGFAALGLWFQSRLAARTLIVFSCAGILFSLSKIGHAPVLRIVTPIAWAIWAITLLVEFLREGSSS